MNKLEKDEMLKKVRSTLKANKSSRRDPDMFRVPSVKPSETAKYRFVVLPGLRKDDKCVGNVVTRSMDDMFYFPGGQHWVMQRPYGCPRQFDNQECPMCNLGFNLLSECDIEEERRKISGLYLSKSIFIANIYFPPFNINPIELQNKVLWYAMPKTVYDKMEACVMREDAGDDPEHDPKPYGMFYDPEDCLVFQLEVTHKGGYNSYENSKFLLTRQSIGETKEDIQAILDRRHDLWGKFPPRNAEELQQLVEKLYNGGGSPPVAKSESPKPKEPKPSAPEPKQSKPPESKPPESKPPESKPPKSKDSEDVMPRSKKAAVVATEDAIIPKAKKPEDTKTAKAPTPTAQSAKPEGEEPNGEAEGDDDIDDPELRKLINDVQGE
jgi:hypothetical protein